jgi:excisionase family DNA binding protein
MSDRRPLAESKEVAAYLGGISVRTLDQWAWKGIGPRFVKVGRHRRYRWSDVEKWLDQQTQETGAA